MVGLLTANLSQWHFFGVCRTIISHGVLSAKLSWSLFCILFDWLMNWGCQITTSTFQGHNSFRFLIANHFEPLFYKSKEKERRNLRLTYVYVETLEKHWWWGPRVRYKTLIGEEKGILSRNRIKQDVETPEERSLRCQRRSPTELFKFSVVAAFHNRIQPFLDVSLPSNSNRRSVYRPSGIRLTSASVQPQLTLRVVVSFEKYSGRRISITVHLCFSVA